MALIICCIVRPFLFYVLRSISYSLTPHCKSQRENTIFQQSSLTLSRCSTTCSLNFRVQRCHMLDFAPQKNFFLRLLGDKPSLGEAKLTHAWSLMRSRGDRGAGSPTDETDGKYLDQGTERLCIPSPPNFFPRL